MVKLLLQFGAADQPTKVRTCYSHIHVVEIFDHLYFTIKLGYRAIDIARAEGHSDVVDALQNAAISAPVSEKVERNLRMCRL